MDWNRMNLQSFINDTRRTEISGYELRRHLDLYCHTIIVMFVLYVATCFATLVYGSNIISITGVIGVIGLITLLFGAITWPLVSNIRRILASEPPPRIPRKPLLDHEKSIVWAGVFVFVDGCFLLAAITIWTHGLPRAAVICLIGAAMSALFALMSGLRAVGEYEDLQHEFDESDSNVIPLHPNSDVA